MASQTIAPSKRLRVFVIDDHPAIREGIASIVATAKEADLEFVGSAGRFSPDLPSQLLEERVNVVIADICFGPSQDPWGIQYIRDIRQVCGPDIGIIGYSFMDKYGPPAQDAGADFFMTKDATDEMIRTAVRTCKRHESIVRLSLNLTAQTVQLHAVTERGDDQRVFALNKGQFLLLFYLVKEREFGQVDWLRKDHAAQKYVFHRTDIWRKAAEEFDVRLDQWSDSTISGYAHHVNEEAAKLGLQAAKLIIVPGPGSKKDFDPAYAYRNAYALNRFLDKSRIAFTR